MSNGHEVGFFTVDKYLGPQKKRAFAKDVLAAVKIFDKANEDLYNELVQVKEQLAAELASNDELIFQIKRLECKLSKKIMDENNKIREQLRDANKVIKHYAFENVKSVEQCGSEEPREIEYPAANDVEKAMKYIKKWGIK